MAPENIPILLTSSVIAYDDGVRLKNTEDRVGFAIESVRQWLLRQPKQPLVLCDGSGFDFSNLISDKFPSANIECLPFENDQTLVKTHGRGYGEGEIVRHAVLNSSLISKSKCFAKCSSKLWVNNFPDYSKSFKKGCMLFKGVFSNVFEPWKSIEFSYIDTRFYVSDVEKYLENFEYAHHMINLEKGFGLEDAFKQIFVKNEIHNSLNTIYPIICGVGGGTGKAYQTSLHRRLKEKVRNLILCRTSKFKNLFVN